MGRYILDAQGEPVSCDDIDKWADWYKVPDNRRLAWDEVDGVQISTVFLSLDHAFTNGPPVLWETLVFGGPLDGEMSRYTSRAEALAGHAEMVTRVKQA